jgi:hypothetical protein
VRSLLFCVFFWSLSAFAQVAPATGEFLNDTEIRGFFANILQQGGFGRWKTERAAFIVRDEKNHYRCVAWPTDGHLYRQQFRGAMPAGTVAIIHTHPMELPEGSQGDKETAARLSIPIFVLTPLNIELITERGVAVPVIHNHLWCEAKPVPSMRCGS